MSLLGFDKIIRKYESAQKPCLTEMMKESRIEFQKNFDTESNAETGQGWSPVLRGSTPPALNVTGSLKGQAVRAGRVTFSGSTATLTIDPIDSRGRGYASYHQDGFHHKQAGWIKPRSFVTQSPMLDARHLKIIHKHFDPIFS